MRSDSEHRSRAVPVIRLWPSPRYPRRLIPPSPTAAARVRHEPQSLVALARGSTRRRWPWLVQHARCHGR
jgi:hypothetical protein